MASADRTRSSTESVQQSDHPAPAATVTIAMIAREAGVSTPTVSKVLNGHHDVAPDTRARVERTLAQHNYQRKQSRRRSGARLIDLVFHELDSGWTMEIIQGVDLIAGAARVGVVLSELGGEHRPPQEWLDDVMARRPLGVIFISSNLDASQRRQLKSRSIPFVILDTSGDPSPGVPTVGSANWNGGLLATRHLLELGHRRVAVITGSHSVLCSKARLDGYRTALDEYGIPLDPDLVRYGNFRVHAGLEHARTLLTLPDPPTAIFAGSDHQALGVLRAARERGMHVPRDLSVVGYDDLPLAQWIGPPLTTVRQPLREMARTATRMLLQLADGRQPTNLRIDLATELIVRESTAPHTPPRHA